MTAGHICTPAWSTAEARGRCDPRTLPALQTIARAALVLAISSSGIVFSEPAPVDLVMVSVIVLLPLAGLTTLAPGMVLQTLVWLGCGAGALIASGVSLDAVDSFRHTAISFYLYLAFLVLAAFVANRPDRHADLILKAWVVAAAVAGLAALAGYFQLLPGAQELFTKFGRAAGTFKDPNVLGPFLVPAILYLAHRALDGDSRWLAAEMAVLVLLIVAVLLSFSRGAWFNLAVALATYGFLRLVCEGSPTARARLLVLAGIGLVVAAAGLLAVSQLEQVATLLAERSALTQGYDVGPEGRFGGQEKALGLALANPLGLGAKQFAEHFHHEDVHNVYLSMLLNAGWLGGLLYVAAVATSLWAGIAHISRATPARGLLLVAFAAFLGNVLEGAIVDTDHWRHFYVLLALIWGLIGANEISRTGGIR
ncbi:MAG: O-antigen ligase family protein [Hyphomicrobiaceae bacterium]|nr:O-antigen ligase family protein [Hyphomicrobiaceae bacterium]